MDRNPGSPEAVKNGCTCPVLDNSHGKGYMGQVGRDGKPIFIISATCPIHGKSFFPWLEGEKKC